MFCIGLSFSVAAQTKPSWRKLSKYEKRWAFFHPFASLKIKKYSPEILATIRQVKSMRALDQFEDGGKIDAFRHAYFMACMGVKVSVRKLRKLGIAHEKTAYRNYRRGFADDHGVLADSLSNVMDLYNNERGFEIAKLNPNADFNLLKEKVLEAIYSGELLYMKRNEEGVLVSCDGTLVPTVQRKPSWFIPKCLIKTNE